MMDFAPGGYQSPFVLGVDKGFYAEAGLDVNVVEGTGSGNTVKYVGAGKAQFGWANFGTAITLISQGLPVTGVSVVTQNGSTAVVTRKALNVKKPDDLKGLRIAAPQGTSDATEFELFLATHKIPESDVERVNVNVAASLQLLAKGDIDGAVYPEVYEVPILESQGVPINVLRFSDFGLNTLEYSIIANNDVVKNNPDLVKRFVRASQRAWTYAADHQDESIAALAKKWPTVNEEIAKNQLAIAVNRGFHTPNTEGKPIGCTDPRDVVETERVLANAHLIPNATGDAKHYYDASFAQC